MNFLKSHFSCWILCLLCLFAGKSHATKIVAGNDDSAGNSYISVEWNELLKKAEFHLCFYKPQKCELFAVASRPHLIWAQQQSMAHIGLAGASHAIISVSAGLGGFFAGTRMATLLGSNIYNAIGWGETLGIGSGIAVGSFTASQMKVINVLRHKAYHDIFSIDSMMDKRSFIAFPDDTLQEVMTNILDLLN